MQKTKFTDGLIRYFTRTFARLFDNAFDLKDHFDLIISNLLYNNNVNLKILTKLINNNIAKQYLLVMPTNWLINLKPHSKLFNSFKELTKDHLVNIECMNGNPVFEITGLCSPIGITHLDFTSKYKKAKVKYFDQCFEANVFNITKYGTAWHTGVKAFFKKMLKITADNTDQYGI